jgi:hypothetical protein
MAGMYHVEYYCPREMPGVWQADPQNPWFIFGNAVQRVNRLIFQYHSARVVDGAGNVLYQA